MGHGYLTPARLDFVNFAGSKLPPQDRISFCQWSALMHVTEHDLDRVLPASHYKVLSRIGQGAFGEVRGSHATKINTPPALTTSAA